jgi:hypothetical protein
LSTHLPLIVLFGRVTCPDTIQGYTTLVDDRRCRIMQWDPSQKLAMPGPVPLQPFDQQSRKASTPILLHTSEYRSPGSPRAINRCTYDAYEKSSLLTSSPNKSATEATSLRVSSRSSHSNSRSWSFPSGAAESRLAARAPHCARARRRIVAATYGR